MPKPYPAEFRRDVIAVACKGDAPLSRIAKDFGISEATLHSWLKKADIDRALLLDASDVLERYDLDEGVRHRLRARFWDKHDQN